MCTFYCCTDECSWKGHLLCRGAGELHGGGVGESKEGPQLGASLVTRFFLMQLERIQGHGKQQQERERFIKAKAHT